MQAAPFEAMLEEAAREVLETMCFMFVEQSASSCCEEALPLSRSLSFSGPVSGSFGLRSSLPTAALIASNLLGNDPDQISSAQAGDTLGEIANMICGSLLCRIDAKQAFSLSHPVAEPILHSSGIKSQRSTRTMALESGPLLAWVEMELNR